MSIKVRYKALVFAAGKSARFQGIKQLARVNDATIVESSFWRVANSDIEDVLLILGHHKTQILSTIDIDNHAVGYVEQAHLGFGVSISEAVTKYVLDEHSDKSVSHVLIALADQVALTTAHFNQLKSASLAHPNKIICCQTSAGICSPVIFSHAYFSSLCQLSGDKGAKSIVMKNMENVITINIDEALIDIDTQEDFLRWQQAQLTSNTLNNKRPIGATIND